MALSQAQHTLWGNKERIGCQSMEAWELVVWQEHLPKYEDVRRSQAASRGALVPWEITECL